ncbi:MAG: hypothetical protein H0X45_09710 [Planctomycetes bacterium]|nr:hypothetical protein [Planctomycetota bacterium]
MWFAHILLVAAWACWLTSLWLPAFARPESDLVMSGFACFCLTIMHPWAFPIFGVANFWLILSPLYARQVGRRCPGWVALLGCGWAMAAVGTAIFVATAPAAGKPDEASGVLIGLVAWSFALCLFASWLALCWLGSRRVHPRPSP